MVHKMNRELTLNKKNSIYITFLEVSKNYLDFQFIVIYKKNVLFHSFSKADCFRFANNFINEHLYYNNYNTPIINTTSLIY